MKRKKLRKEKRKRKEKLFACTFIYIYYIYFYIYIFIYLLRATDMNWILTEFVVIFYNQSRFMQTKRVVGAASGTAFFFFWYVGYFGCRLPPGIIFWSDFGWGRETCDVGYRIDILESRIIRKVNKLWFKNLVGKSWN